MQTSSHLCPWMQEIPNRWTICYTLIFAYSTRARKLPNFLPIKSCFKQLRTYLFSGHNSTHHPDRCISSAFQFQACLLSDLPWYCPLWSSRCVAPLFASFCSPGLVGYARIHYARTYRVISQLSVHSMCYPVSTSQICPAPAQGNTRQTTLPYHHPSADFSPPHHRALERYSVKPDNWSSAKRIRKICYDSEWNRKSTWGRPSVEEIVHW